MADRPKNKPKAPRSKIRTDASKNIENRDPGDTRDQKRYPIVGIVGSAGGLHAFNRFFNALPAKSGAAYVVVPHLDAAHKSLMAELLGRQTSVPVLLAEDSVVVEMDHVYVIPPNRLLTMEHGKLRLRDFPIAGETQTAIDIFLRSLAADQSERAVGIVLSGTGSHGTLGLREIKRCGGIAMAQTPESAEFDQMPRNAIESGVVDFVLTPEQMPETLLNYIQQPYLQSPAILKPRTRSPFKELQAIIDLIREQTKYDFSYYRKNMLLRRVERRMGLLQLTDHAAYLKALIANPQEIQSLFKDFLIDVTQFFREPEAYKVVEDEVLPALIAKRSTDMPIRVWVPACSTGEEAYSIAILLFEAFTAAGEAPHFQVFASDINDESLDFARRGIYPANIAIDVSASRIQQFFEPTGEMHYRVNKKLRDCIVFSKQNLLSDAPFSKMDLLSCRNVMIYLEPEVQQKLVSLFHFALNQDGYLVLGSAESIGREVRLFEPVSKTCRVYRRAGPAKSSATKLPAVAAPIQHTFLREPSLHPSKKTYKELAESLLNDYVPASVLINRHHEILNVTGPVVNFLEFPPGEISKDLLALARQGLRTRLRLACHKAIMERKLVRDRHARVKRDGSYFACSIIARPVPEANSSDDLILVIFSDRRPDQLPIEMDEPAAAGFESVDTTLKAPLVDLLEFELKATREELQGITEQLRSGIEELQSSNEELESSKEELQSLNEELTTVNCQLLEKVADFERSEEKTRAILASLSSQIVVVDSQGLIVATNPAWDAFSKYKGGIPEQDGVGANYFRVLASDAAIRLNADATESSKKLADGLRTILEGKADDFRMEYAVHAANEKRWFLLQATPLRSGIGGAVISHHDITDRVLSEQRSRNNEQLLQLVVDTVPHYVYAKNREGAFIFANQYTATQSGFSSPTELVGNSPLQSAPDADQAEKSREMELEVLNTGVPLLDIEEKIIDWQGKTHLVQTSKLRFALPETNEPAVLCVSVDITDRKMAAQQLHENAERLRAILDTASDAIITVDSQGNINSVNQATEALFGYTSAELSGSNVSTLMPKQIRSGSESITSRFISPGNPEGRANPREVICSRKDGTTFPAELAVSQMDHLGLSTWILRDISSRKAMQRHALEIAANEQRRIGFELHDGTQQELTGLALFANALLGIIESASITPSKDDAASRSYRMFIESDYDRIRETASLLTTRLSEANRHVRDLAHGIMPVQLDGEGLRSALHDLADSISTEKVRCDVKLSEDIGQLPISTATHLYRIAQEAASNAIQHGSASRILLAILREEQGLLLEVEDNGIGFDLAKYTRSTSANQGMGLQTMQYRASLIGGVMQFENRPEGGSIVRCLILHDVQDDG